MKRLLFAAIFSVFSTSGLYAQESINIPENYVFEDQETIKKYEKDVIPIINWLESRPIMSEDPTYKKARTFITDFTTWSESVDITGLNQKITKFSETSPDLLLYFIGGMAKYQLQHPGQNDKIKENTAALESVIKYYKSQPDMETNDTLEELYALKEKGQLQNWVKEQLAE